MKQISRRYLLVGLLMFMMVGCGGGGSKKVAVENEGSIVTQMDENDTRIDNNETDPDSNTTVPDIDTVAPNITMSLVIQKGVTTSESMTVYGTASDLNGVEEVKVNGIVASTSNQYADWTATVPLATGENPFNLLAIDSFGNQRKKEDILDVYRGPVLERVREFVFDALNERYIVLDNRRKLIAIDMHTGKRSLFSDLETESNNIRIRNAGRFVFDKSNKRILLSASDERPIPFFRKNRIISINFDNKREIISDINVGSGPIMQDIDAMLLDNENKRILAIDRATDALFAIDLNTGNRMIISDFSVVGDISFATTCGMALDSRQNLLFLNKQCDQGTNPPLYVIDLENGKRAVFIYNVGIGGNMRELVMDNENHRLYGIDRRDKKIFSIDVETKIVSTVSSENIGEGAKLQYSVDMVLNPITKQLSVLDAKINEILHVNIENGNRSILSNPYTGTGIKINSGFRLILGKSGTSAYTIGNRVDTIYKIDLKSGKRSVLSSKTVGTGVILESIADLDLDEKNNRLLVVDSSIRALIAIDLDTGNRRVISYDEIVGDGVPFEYPKSIAVDSNQSIAYIADDENKILRVDLDTGRRTVISDDNIGDGVEIHSVRKVILDVDNNRLLVAANVNTLLSLDLSTRRRQIISNENFGEGVSIDGIYDLTLDMKYNRVLIVDRDEKRMMSVDLANGNRTVLSDKDTGKGVAFLYPSGIALGKNGHYAYVMDIDRLFMVDVTVDSRGTGDRVLISR